MIQRRGDLCNILHFSCLISNLSQKKVSFNVDYIHSTELRERPEKGVNMGLSLISEDE